MGLHSLGLALLSSVLQRLELVVDLLHVVEEHVLEVRVLHVLRDQEALRVLRHLAAVCAMISRIAAVNCHRDSAIYSKDIFSNSTT